MAIPRIDFIETPYEEANETGLLWLGDEKRYVPSVDLIMNEAYFDIVKQWGNSKENAQSYLDLLSRVVYNCIYSRYSNKYKDYTEYYLSHSIKARETLKEIFLDTSWYNRRDGGFMMAYNTGINLNTGKEVLFEINKVMSVIGNQIISNNYLGNHIPQYNLNNFYYFETLEEMLENMIINGLITAIQAGYIESIDEIPKSPKYRVFINEHDFYVWEDLLTWKRIIGEITTQIIE